MVCDILVRSYRRDFEWLGYCLESIVARCDGFREAILVLPAADEARLPRLRLPAGVRVELCRDYRDDYLGQQATKLYADTYSDADLICHVDADCVFGRRIVPADLLREGRPVVFTRRLSELPRGTPWRRPTEAFLGWQVELDFMQRQPRTFPHWLYGELRAFCRERHGRELEEYVTSRPPRAFSEYNVLAAYALHFHRDAFAWVDATSPGAGLELCRWYWSWGGIDARLRRELDAVVGRAASGQV